MGIDSHAQQLTENGFTLLKGVFDSGLIESTRSQILDNLTLFKNTRPTASAGHLAGFHRYPQFESLQTRLTNDQSISEILKLASGDEQLITIGLSDLTINRSQQWHNDLLRGTYKSYLDDETCWGEQGGGVYKILLYLQEGKSLKVVPGSHRQPVVLESDRFVVPKDDSSVTGVSVGPGDVILMDIRLTHRGSTEPDMQSAELSGSSKILVTTVVGGSSKPLTHAMELGNFKRLKDWDQRNAHRRYVAA